MSDTSSFGLLSSSSFLFAAIVKTSVQTLSFIFRRHYDLEIYFNVICFLRTCSSNYFDLRSANDGDAFQRLLYAATKGC